jgi:alcohol dehydrogenase
MHTKAAVIYELGKPTPYRVSRPFVIEQIALDGPHEGEVLVRGHGQCRWC